MKIVVVCDVLGKKNNGTTIAAYNLINFLKSKGHDVKVVCCDEDKKDTDGFIILNKLNLGPLNKIIERNGVSLPRTDSNVILDAFFECDIVHIMLPFPMGMTACKIAKKLGKPVTAGFHCQAELVSSHLGLMNSKFLNKHIYKTFYRRLYQYCDAIHYPTQFICDVFENIVGTTNHYIISNGVNSDVKNKDINKPDEFKDKFVILSTGRLCPEKSHMVLLKAIANSKYKDKIQLILAGQGPLQTKIEKYADKHLTIKPVIKYFTRDEMINVLNYSDLYVHPAEAELEGIACLEALVCGLVPIVSDSERSATKSFALTDNNLFKCNNHIDLKNKIEYWIEHPQEKMELKKQYIKYGENFNIEDCMNKMEKMFIETINKRVN